MILCSAGLVGLIEFADEHAAPAKLGKWGFPSWSTVLSSVPLGASYLVYVATGTFYVPRALAGRQSSISDD